MTDNMKYSKLDDSELNIPKYEHLRDEAEKKKQSEETKKKSREETEDQHEK